MITCGHCHEQHATIAQVRECSGTASMKSYATRPKVQAKPQSKPQGYNGTMTMPKAAATEKQVNFLKSLASERKAWRTAKNLTDEAIEHLSKEQASDLITEALATPKDPKPAGPNGNTFPNVPEGYYAIDIDDTVKFYRVSKPTEGQWKGWTFVDVQASDDFWPVRSKDSKRTILEAIVAQGINESMARYGKVIGRCGVCNRTLTDEVSRALGIGPVCREKM